MSLQPQLAAPQSSSVTKPDIQPSPQPQKLFPTTLITNATEQIVLVDGERACCPDIDIERRKSLQWSLAQTRVLLITPRQEVEFACKHGLSFQVTLKSVRGASKEGA